jgi:hypothetical protein
VDLETRDVGEPPIQHDTPSSPRSPLVLARLLGFLFPNKTLWHSSPTLLPASPCLTRPHGTTSTIRPCPSPTPSPMPHPTKLRPDLHHQRRSGSTGPADANPSPLTSTPLPPAASTRPTSGPRWWPPCAASRARPSPWSTRSGPTSTTAADSRVGNRGPIVGPLHAMAWHVAPRRAPLSRRRCRLERPALQT